MSDNISGREDQEGRGVVGGINPRRHPLLRKLYQRARHFSVPVPRPVSGLMWNVFSVAREGYYWVKSTFLVSPMYRGLASSVGKSFRAGTYIPYVRGTGRIFIGSNVRLYGKQTFLFASIRPQVPEIHIGDGTTMGHNIVFDIAGTVTIGRHCLIASDVLIQDCAGHALVAERRLADEAPSESDIREIFIGDNVWIGTGAFILPGARIGDNCVISANTLVSRSIPGNSLVYSVQSKIVEIRDISKIL